jgi:hypothetical protein
MGAFAALLELLLMSAFSCLLAWVGVGALFGF